MHTSTNPNTCMVPPFHLEPVLTTLRQGGLILYPTDTIWGIGCDATNTAAVERLRDIRNPRPGSPLVLLAASIEMLKNYVPFVHPRLETLLLYHTRPLTIIYEQARNLPTAALGEDGSVAFRIPHDEFCQSLVENLGRPVVATAAQAGSGDFPRHFGEISSTVIQAIDYVVKLRQMQKEMPEPSVIARLAEDEELVFLRE